ncbi:MAG: hypothetical protein HQK59_11170 [Deltaproteobacteria bacterium]|nr:hypothetical protein [Deltaproteobacteria bacterium]
MSTLAMLQGRVQAEISYSSSTNVTPLTDIASALNQALRDVAIRVLPPQLVTYQAMGGVSRSYEYSWPTADETGVNATCLQVLAVEFEGRLLKRIDFRDLGLYQQVQAVLATMPEELFKNRDTTLKELAAGFSSEICLDVLRLLSPADLVTRATMSTTAGQDRYHIPEVNDDGTPMAVARVLGVKVDGQALFEVTAAGAHQYQTLETQGRPQWWHVEDRQVALTPCPDQTGWPMVITVALEAALVGRPSLWMLRGRKVRIYPAPVYDKTGNMRVHFLKSPAELVNDNDQPELSEELQDTMVLKAASICLFQDQEFHQAEAKKAEYEAKISAIAERLKAA